jgi:hypothetical protein
MESCVRQARAMEMRRAQRGHSTLTSPGCASWEGTCSGAETTARLRGSGEAQVDDSGLGGGGTNDRLCRG